MNKKTKALILSMIPKWIAMGVLIGIVIFSDNFLAKSIALWEELPFDPSILMGLPMTIPFILFSLIICVISFSNFSNLFFSIIVRGVATFLFSSQIANPMLLFPGSIPNNLELFPIFVLNSSILSILYVFILNAIFLLICQ